MEKEFIDSLRKKYNPEGSDLRKYQMELLKILVEFDKFCKEHGLSYSLAYGTLLGAVRHQGFIPWDDDVDIMMTREQYNALLQVIGSADNVILNEKLSIRRRLKPEICMKGIGICDLFIIDYVPKGSFKQWIKKSCIQLLQWLYRCRSYYESWRSGGKPHIKAWQVLMPIGLCRSLQGWQKSWERVLSWFSSKESIDKTRMCCYTAAVRDIPRIFPSEAFDDAVNMDFEGYSFPCIKGYHEFLSSRYGNYMDLPNAIHNHGRLSN